VVEGHLDPTVGQWPRATQAKSVGPVDLSCSDAAAGRQVLQPCTHGCVWVCLTLWQLRQGEFRQLLLRTGNPLLGCAPASQPLLCNLLCTSVLLPGLPGTRRGILRSLRLCASDSGGELQGVGRLSQNRSGFHPCPASSGSLQCLCSYPSGIGRLRCCNHESLLFLPELCCRPLLRERRCDSQVPLLDLLSACLEA